MNQVHFWLRAESKKFEQRTPLTPTGAKNLIKQGVKITVEKSADRIFLDKEYQKVGCSLVLAGSWIKAEPSTIILGLKELPDATSPLVHKHIYFAHAYKNQNGWKSILQRFAKGGGKLFDLEYLLDDQQKRVAAFGYWAGYAGAAIGVIAWCNQMRKTNSRLGPINSFASKDELVNLIQEELNKVQQSPSLFIIGALGRCGSGVLDFCKELDLNSVGWDYNETRSGGPFQEINSSDIFINAAFVNGDIPPFLNSKSLNDFNRKLSVVVDVGCDPYSSYNPIPIYKECTTFQDPCSTYSDLYGHIEVISIDHLPSLLPLESSEEYAGQLFLYLSDFLNKENKTWTNALQIFEKKLTEI